MTSLCMVSVVLDLTSSSTLSKSYRGTSQIALEDNYRSHPHILEVANNLIVNNTERLVKRLKG
jgi:superfamily I DNA/RNA helicase